MKTPVPGRVHQKPDDAENLPFHPVETAESAIVRQGIAMWQELRGERRFPARRQITLRKLGALAKYAVLIRVVDGGKDLEFRFVGNVPVSAVGANFQGRRLSEPEIASVMRANYRAQLYEEVLRTGRPWVFKRRTINEWGVNLPIRSETVYMPLGDDDDTVDHLLGFTVYSTEPGS